jgi:putative phage-type endonuclease
MAHYDLVMDKLLFVAQKNGLFAQKKDVLEWVSDMLSLVYPKNTRPFEIEKRLGVIARYKQQLQALLHLPKLEQRTPLWYETRNNMITASDFAQAVNKGKFGTQKDFYAKKCGYEPDKFDQTMPALIWGIKFEQVANDAYSMKNSGMIVHEFGLIQHPEFSWLGASPDGITETGIMLEIKCPYKRKITGEIPEQYYYQIQGQLDVCDLDECDYLECEFLQYYDRGEFVTHFNDNENFKGIIVETMSEPKYMYVDPKLWFDCDAQLTWLDDVCAKIEVKALTFWQLNTYSVSRVYKDAAFVETMYDQLSKVWETVTMYKQDKKRYDEYMNVNTKRKGKEVATSAGELKDCIEVRTEGKYDHVMKGKDVKFMGYAFVDE